MADMTPQPPGSDGHAAADRVAVPEVTAQDAAEALRRGHHTHVMNQPAARRPRKARTTRGKTATTPPKAGSKSRGAGRQHRAKAGAKGGSRVRRLVEEGHKYEEEHAAGSKKGGRTKRSAKRRTPKAGGKRAAASTRTR